MLLSAIEIAVAWTLIPNLNVTLDFARNPDLEASFRIAWRTDENKLLVYHVAIRSSAARVLELRYISSRAQNRSQNHYIAVHFL